jgi:hypothetical protein
VPPRRISPDLRPGRNCRGMAGVGLKAGYAELVYGEYSIFMDCCKWKENLRNTDE